MPKENLTPAPFPSKTASLKDKFIQKLKDRRWILIICLLLLVFAGTYIFISPRRAKKAKPTPTISSLIEDLVSKEEEVGFGKIDKTPTVPTILFDRYELKTTLPELPEETSIFSLKTNFSDEEIKNLGTKLNLTDEPKFSSASTLVITNTTDSESYGILIFDRQTGGFEFQSFGMHSPSQITDSPIIAAQSFLEEIGLWDKAFIPTTTYTRDWLPDITFVEFHRDWERVGLPILNIVGLLNINENVRLSQLSLGKTNSNLPQDSEINWSSDGKTGQARPNDFNTITVAVTKDGRILNVASNIRTVNSTHSTSELADSDIILKTPQEALTELEQGQGVLSLTIPTGEREVDWEKVYPENKAHSSLAEITDVSFAYLEKPAGVIQNYLQPVYVFRGTSTLDSGYRVQFAQAIAAVKTSPLGRVPKLNNSHLSLKLKTQAQVLALDNNSDELCDTSRLKVFELPGIGKVGYLGPAKFTLFYIPEGNTSEIKSIEEIREIFYDLVARQYAINVCRYLVEVKGALPSFSAPPLVEEIYALFDEIAANPKYSNDSSYNGPEFYRGKYAKGKCPYVAEKTAKKLINILTVPTPTPTPIFTPTLTPTPWPTLTITPTPTPEEIFEPLGDLKLPYEVKAWAVKADLFPASLRKALWITLYETGGERYKDSTNCPYLSGESPSIYLYPESKTQIKVEVCPQTKVVHADPGPLNQKCQIWETIANPDGTLEISDSKRTRLYYEYQKINFPKPKEGFVIKTENLDSFLLETLFPALGLTRTEQEDLLADVKSALRETRPTPYIQITLVEPETAASLLPLKITPSPTIVHRLHLLLTPLDKPSQLPEPTIAPLSRIGFTVVETGVTVQDQFDL